MDVLKYLENYLEDEYRIRPTSFSRKKTVKMTCYNNNK